MATNLACPDNNCLALARYPTGEPLPMIAPPGTTAKRAAAAAAAVAESFAAVATPLLQKDGLPFNRVTLVVNLDTQGTAINEYREQLKRALATLDRAVAAKLPSVEVSVQVPDQITQGRKPNIQGAETTPGKTTTTVKKGGKDKAAPKKDKNSTKKKKKS
jgi:hypothetical protein